ncbi:DUF1080 domain-containing protein [Prolixibacteraceae bacterium Z1-6]|uniref:DUF1080 domain-containing protein n=1 Tax=Draconibacterium aestuarii TaxID=2998507 RepID=A0A9X3F3U1_9BACT|nr:DUF1080 domain-containing protein [Prolixibacteraceae bacterium Z1-6]
MKKLILSLLMVCTIVPVFSQNKLSEEQKKEGWKLLFDGTNLNSFRGLHKNENVFKGWTVENGCMKTLQPGNDEAGGALITKKKYADFEFQWDWKMESKGGNSGVKYYVLEELSDSKKSGIGLEYQMLDDNNHEWMLNGKMQSGDFHTLGALYEIYPAKNRKINPLDEWNTSRIVSKNNHVEHWLNGVEILEYERGSADFKEKVANSKFSMYPGFGEAKKGHILIQDHGSVMYFKNLFIREL